MRKKIIIILLIIPILFLMLYNTVYAGTNLALDTSIFGDGSGNDGSGSQGNNTLPTATINMGTDSNGFEVSCKYSYWINTANNITFDAFNQENKSIISGTLTANQKIPAGTAVGISIIETKSISWGVSDITVTKTKRNEPLYRCTKKCNKRQLLEGNCINNVYYDTSCRSGYTWELIRDTGTSTVTLTSGTEVDTCRNDALARIRNKIGDMSPSYEIKLQNSNDINANNTTSTKAVSTSNCSSTDRSKTCTFLYTVNKTCIDVKTAEVRYITNNGTCNSNEIEVKKDSNHWHYFVPLNAKSNDNFFLSVSSAGNNVKQSANACKYVINNYSNYKDFIITSNEKQFSGNKNKDLATANSGCYLSSVINIPVEQKFYNEENNTIKGYSFYYKPIDINNPFPNGLTDKSSYWYDWYKSNKKTPDLTKSFEKMTYIANNIDTETIRSYNQDNKYTSWQDMKINGRSEFIDKYVTRNFNITKDSFYKLGCGPMNKDWEECK